MKTEKWYVSEEAPTKRRPKHSNEEEIKKKSGIQCGVVASFISCQSARRCIS